MVSENQLVNLCHISISVCTKINGFINTHIIKSWRYENKHDSHDNHYGSFRYWWSKDVASIRDWYNVLMNNDDFYIYNDVIIANDNSLKFIVFCYICLFYICIVKKKEDYLSGRE